MNINNINNLSFGKIFVNNEKMGTRAKELARQLEYEIDYSDSISLLDDFGVDVVIMADSRSPEDKINFYLRNREVPSEIVKTKKARFLNQLKNKFE